MIINNRYGRSEVWLSATTNIETPLIMTFRWDFHIKIWNEFYENI